MQISHGSKAAQLTAVLDADGGGRQQTSVLEKTPVLEKLNPIHNESEQRMLIWFPRSTGKDVFNARHASLNTIVFFGLTCSCLKLQSVFLVHILPYCKTIAVSCLI